MVFDVSMGDPVTRFKGFFRS